MSQRSGCIEERWKSLICVVLAVGVCLPLSIFYPMASKSDILTNIKNNILFYLFFACWICRYIPQISINRSRNSTLGMSPDFTLWHLVANSCITILFILHTYFGYKDNLLWLGMSQNPILGSIFIFENMLSILVIASQTLKLNGGWKMHKPSWPLMILITLMAIVTIVSLTLVKFLFGSMMTFEAAFNKWQTILVYLFFCASIFRLIPQIQLNIAKQSTVGFSLAYTVLDFTGAAAVCVSLILKNLPVLSSMNPTVFTNELIQELMFMVTCFIVLLGDLILMVHGFNLKNKDDGFIPISLLHSIAPSGALGTMNSGVGVTSSQDIQLENAIAVSMDDIQQDLHGSSSHSHYNSQSWACVRCTYVNDFTRNECEVCKLSREKSVQPGSRSQDEALLFGSRV